MEAFKHLNEQGQPEGERGPVGRGGEGKWKVESGQGTRSQKKEVGSLVCLKRHFSLPSARQLSSQKISLLVLLLYYCTVTSIFPAVVGP